jgi:NAD(P)-dependent dehydrogenase (short-subunit alcohol dehydrogenase family)
MLTQLDGKVAVVTGAASGIGRALCAGLAAEGMKVVCADIDAAGAATVAAGLDDAISVTADVSDQDAVNGLADSAFEQWGQVDLLCNNAGVFQAGLSWQRSLGDWDWVLGVNVYGIIHGIAAFVPRMIEQDTEGHVVNTASVAAFVTAGGIAPYTVSKAAAFSLTECLAQDLLSVGSLIGASVLTPSAFDTGIAFTSSVRPDRFGSDDSTHAQAMNEALAAMTGAGMAPEEVVQPVLEGVRSGTFLIPTRPSYAQQLDDRYRSLAAREVPGVSIVD